MDEEEGAVDAMKTSFHILDESHVPRPASSLEEGAAFFEDGKNRIVAQDTVGHILVSTVFLGLDHGFGGEPLWFETMVFNTAKAGQERWLDLDQERYATWGEAIEGHARMLANVMRM